MQRKLKFKTERELKFRCWDGIGNHGMTYFDDLSEVSNFYRGHKYQDEMQFTGMRDMERKEVYENDILETHCIDEPGKVHIGGMGSLHVVKFEEGAFVLIDLYDPLKAVPISELNKSDYLFKVIGNIHQHPHLLQEQEE